MDLFIVGVVVFVVFYIVCVVLSYGFVFAFYQGEYPNIAKWEYESNKEYALKISLFGPITLIFIIIDGDYRFGLKFK